MGQQQDPTVAMKALQGVRALQGEVSLLKRDPASREDIIRLLSKVILFRLSLADTNTENTNLENNRGKS